MKFLTVVYIGKNTGKIQHGRCASYDKLAQILPYPIRELKRAFSNDLIKHIFIVGMREKNQSAYQMFEEEITDLQGTVDTILAEMGHKAERYLEIMK